MNEDKAVVEEQEVATEFAPEIHSDLRLLIEFANDERMSVNFPVTVWVKGSQMSGQVAAAKEGRLWFIHKLADGFKHNATISSSAQMAPEIKTAALEAISAVIEARLPAMVKAAEEVSRSKRYAFLTMKNARVWKAGDVEPSRVEMLRIRLDQIDAFTLGEPSDR